MSARNQDSKTTITFSEDEIGELHFNFKGLLPFYGDRDASVKMRLLNRSLMEETATAAVSAEFTVLE